MAQLVVVLRSVFLGIVQGLTEFLPVSSSAHLNIFPWLFKWKEISPSFDLALHAGTLLAILVYFFKDWINLIKGGYSSVFKHKRTTEGRIFWYIVIATIPAGLLGKVFEKLIEKATGENIDVNMIIISIALIVMGIVLYVVDKRASTDVTLNKLKFKPAFLIGLSQAIAGAVPGVSRSGITMSVGRAYGLDREAAAKYSFLLSAPMIAGALLLSIGDFKFSLAFVLGVIASFVTGILVIRFLMNYLKRGGYGVFAIYRVVFGLFILITSIIRLV